MRTAGKLARWACGLLGMLVLQGGNLEAAEASGDWEIRITSGLPSGVAFPGEKTEFRVTVFNRTDQKKTLTVTIGVQAPGEKERLETWTAEIAGKSAVGRTLTLPTDAVGYWGIRAKAGAGDEDVARTQSALAVVPIPRNYGQTDAGSFFGSMFNEDPEAGQRIGIKFERVMAPWEWLAPGESSYFWERLDARLALLKSRGVLPVLNIRPEMPPKWAKWKSLQELGRPEFLPYFRKFVRDLVEHCGDRVAAVEMMNEPDLECARGLTGKATGAQVYATLLDAAYGAVKEVAPELPVIGLDVSGVDFPGLPFSRAVLDEGTKALEIIGGHPYTSSRYVGGGAQAESPDAIDTRGRFLAMADLLRAHGIEPRIWSTELGWALHKDESMNSHAAELQAAYVAQAIALVRSVPEAEKLFWFSCRFPGYEGAGFTYALFWGAPDRKFPTPGVAVFATCARFLDDVRFVRGIALGGSAKALRFTDRRSGEGVFVLWLAEPRSVGGEITLEGLGKMCAGWEASDGYGRPVRGDLPVRALPLFIRVRAAEADRFEGALRSVRWKAGKTLLVERAFLSDQATVMVDVVNNSGSPLPVKVFFKGQPDRAISRRLSVGASTVRLALDAPLAGKGDLPLELLEETSGERREIPLSYDLVPIVALSQVTIDGELKEVSGLPSLSADRREQVLPADPGIDWKGPGDLSMRVWSGWTAAGLYLAVRVTDDVFAGDPPGANFWEKDSLQIAWDFGNRAEAGYGAHCLELGVYSAGSRAEVRETYPESRIRKDVLAAVRREKDATVYELFAPWKALGEAEPMAGRIFRMNVIANDNDGRSRKCWIGLAPGIGESKRPLAFRQWILKTSPSGLPNP